MEDMRRGHLWYVREKGRERRAEGEKAREHMRKIGNEFEIKTKKHRKYSYESRVLAGSHKCWVPVLILVLTHCDMWSQFKISLILIHSLRLIMLRAFHHCTRASLGKFPGFQGYLETA